MHSQIYSGLSLIFAFLRNFRVVYGKSTKKTVIYKLTVYICTVKNVSVKALWDRVLK